MIGSMSSLQKTGRLAGQPISQPVEAGCRNDVVVISRQKTNCPRQQRPRVSELWIRQI